MQPLSDKSSRMHGRPPERSQTNRDAVIQHLVSSGISARELAGGLTTKLLRRLPDPPSGKAFYELSDSGPSAMPGLCVRVGRRKGIVFSVKVTFKPTGAKEAASARVILGPWAERAGEEDRLSLKTARERASAVKAEMRNGADPRRKARKAKEEAEAAARPIDITLRKAYANYLVARTGKKRKPLSPVTKAGYDRVIERSLVEFADKTLRELAEDPQPLIDHFEKVTQDRPAEANTRMRVLRAVWNRAHKTFPARVPPPPAIFDLNEVEARNAGFVTAETPVLWKAIEAIQEPLRKKAVLTYLILGLRDGGALPMKKEHIDPEAKTVLVWTKGKKLKLPLSALALSLVTAPLPENLVEADNPYVLPSLRGPRPGKRKVRPAPEEVAPFTHVDNVDCSDLPVPAAYVEQKGEDARCHPHCFRHTYRTLATASKTSDVAIRLLMGHSLKGDVSFDYLTEDLTWLREAQETVSRYILKAAGLDTDFVFPADYFVKAQTPKRESAGHAKLKTGELEAVA